MNLLISELQSVDAALDNMILWSDDLGSDLVLGSVEIETFEYQGQFATDRGPVWFQPRLSALRQLFGGE